MRMKILLFPLLLLALLWVTGFFWFIDFIPRHNVDDTTTTDAIVVLTGGSERTHEGVDLLDKGLSDMLFISGVGKGVTVRELLLADGYSEEKAQELADRIYLGFSATNTLENAEEVAAWVEGYNIGSLRLVTSNYHMPRSLLKLKSAMPDTIIIIPHPVSPDHVKLDKWWDYPGTRRLLLSEYNKYLVASARYTYELYVQRKEE